MIGETENISSAQLHLTAGRKCYEKEQYTNALGNLKESQRCFILFPTFFAPQVRSTTQLQEFLLVRECYEYQCMCHARIGNAEKFVSTYMQLETYYTDFSHEKTQPSSKRWLIFGLFLTALLVSDHRAEFYCWVESLPPKIRETPYIQPIILLEKSLQEENLNQIRYLRSELPTLDYSSFLEQIEKKAKLNSEKHEGNETEDKKLIRPALGTRQIDFPTMIRDYLSMARKFRQMA